MQKIIIIAILAAVAFSAAVNVDDGTGSTPAVGTKAGYVVSMGVIQRCHRSCLTCSGPLAGNCLTCEASMTLDATAKTCGCATATHYLSAASNKPICELKAAQTATLAVCNTISAYVNGAAAAGGAAGTLECVLCPSKFNHCSSATVTKATDKLGCWGDVTSAAVGGVSTCTYAAGTSFVESINTAYDSATTTINGYYHDSTTFEFKPCNAGCLTCTATEKCSTCATGFTAVGTAKTACECSTTGFFTTAATATAVDLCTACGTGCITCSSATVCTTCDSSHQLGATTASSSTCESIVATTSTATSTTDGEKDGETTSATATDATSTNGVLLTAASMLLAVILA